MTMRLLLTTALAFGLVACSEDREAEVETNAVAAAETMEAAAETAADTASEAAEAAGDRASAMAEGAANRLALEAAVRSDLRSPEAKARDKYRHPVETILFFGIEPDDVVVEVWPGAGYYTDILAPYLASGGGKLYAASFNPESENPRIQEALANFKEKYVDHPEVYGDVEMTVLAADRQEIAPPGSADVVVTFRNVHNFEMGGWSEEAFAAFYDALKPGGTLGVVDHRLPEDRDKTLEKSSGYIKESTVRKLAEDAGFVFDASSEINANPADTADHPFGVWTLPPNSRTSGRDGTTPEGFDPQKYLDIGESDRMTLRFVKPMEPEESLLE
ncbi:class I SAM-dependent methyltransferase [Parvularcula lutaonensis]|uniref:Class I SAM-dependent methyltransferase n=1 Tax=Parvularcula lutaonensis TaxID=491923 RepID=A0ABV7M9K6_9PROT|nr:class I SAM-dependent methyltransferase [Parvularcula lutaonensis]GGY44771.1 methyltransferase [Parvularcula lutaonensis]